MSFCGKEVKINRLSSWKLQYLLCCVAWVILLLDSGNNRFRKQKEKTDG